MTTGRPALPRAPWFAGLFLLAAAPLSAQTPPPPTRSATEGVYTEEQAERGRATFEQSCTSCHTGGEFAGEAFVRRWATLGSLFDIMSSTMPQDFPGSLTPAQYADVISYFLRLNTFPAGETELPAGVQPLNSVRLQPLRR